MGLQPSFRASAHFFTHVPVTKTCLSLHCRHRVLFLATIRPHREEITHFSTLAPWRPGDTPFQSGDTDLRMRQDDVCAPSVAQVRVFSRLPVAVVVLHLPPLSFISIARSSGLHPPSPSIAHYTVSLLHQRNHALADNQPFSSSVLLRGRETPRLRE